MNGAGLCEFDAPGLSCVRPAGHGSLHWDAVMGWWVRVPNNEAQRAGLSAWTGHLELHDAARPTDVTP